MGKNEIYFRVKRMLIIILVLMVIFSFVAIVNLNGKVEDLTGAQNILIEYVSRTK